MAPELPAWLRIYDFHSVDPNGATVLYVEPPIGTRTLRVRWEDLTPPEGFQPIGEGVAFVSADVDAKVAELEHSLIKPQPAGNRYKWHEGVPWREGAERIEQVMLVLILPPGHSLANPTPPLIQAKVWEQQDTVRIAVYWILIRNQQTENGVTVAWDLVPLAQGEDPQEKCNEIDPPPPRGDPAGKVEEVLENPPPPPVVFGLHGIRTYGEWQKSLVEVAGEKEFRASVSRWSFGYFSSIRFLLPWERKKKLALFRKTYHDEINDRTVGLEEGQLPSIVAHSFGTYLVGYALERFPELKFDRILLCGSILPTDFKWKPLFEDKRIRRLRIEYGVRDPWVRLVGWFVAGAGPSGANGFAIDSPDIEQRSFDYDHSEYLEKGHMRDEWVPFFKGRDKPSQAPEPGPGPKKPWLAYLLLFVLAGALIGSVAVIIPPHYEQGPAVPTAPVSSLEAKVTLEAGAYDTTELIGILSDITGGVVLEFALATRIKGETVHIGTPMREVALRAVLDRVFDELGVAAEYEIENDTVTIREKGTVR